MNSSGVHFLVFVGVSSLLMSVVVGLVLAAVVVFQFCFWGEKDDASVSSEESATPAEVLREAFESLTQKEKAELLAEIGFQ